MVFPPTAPWWSAGLKTPQGISAPFAGRRLGACKTSALPGAIAAYAVSADGSVVVGGTGYTAFRWTASGGIQDLGTPAAGGGGPRLMLFPPTAPWWSATLPTPHGHGVAFRWTASGGMQQPRLARGDY
jgi:hypothetical protein